MLWEIKALTYSGHTTTHSAVGVDLVDLNNVVIRRCQDVPCLWSNTGQQLVINLTYYCF